MPQGFYQRGPGTSPELRRRHPRGSAVVDNGECSGRSHVPGRLGVVVGYSHLEHCVRVRWEGCAVDSAIAAKFVEPLSTTRGAELRRRFLEGVTEASEPRQFGYLRDDHRSAHSTFARSGDASSSPGVDPCSLPG